MIMAHAVTLDYERIYINHPEFYGQEMINRHINRYRVANSYLKDTDVVLDACCGSGYGSNMLAENVDRVIGMDNNAEAVAYAKKHYKRNNLSFLQIDLNEISRNNIKRNFDAVVAIEAIEHFTQKEAEQLLRYFSFCLKKKGKLILTTPNKNKSDGKNQYHKKEYTTNAIDNMLSKYFNVLELYTKDDFIYIVAEKK